MSDADSSKWVEVEFHHAHDDRPKHEDPCPACGGDLRYSSISCPDGRPDCCVLHYGWRCQGCYKTWRKAESLTISKTPWPTMASATTLKADPSGVQHGFQ